MSTFLVDLIFVFVHQRYMINQDIYICILPIGPKVTLFSNSFIVECNIFVVIAILFVHSPFCCFVFQYSLNYFFYSQLGIVSALECLQTPTGTEYKGQLNVTKSGLSCLPWAAVDDSPYTENMFPDDILNRRDNFCRNPRGDRAAPWCYVNQKNLSLEECDLLSCGKSV